MFSVIFEVHPKPERWDAYLGQAGLLKPELERIDGFVDNVRYRSLTREGWVLSLSGWRDEKSVVRWRTKAGHHMAQEKGRGDIMLDYHLRVGEIVADSRLPDGCVLAAQRFDETETGEARAIVLIDAKRPGQLANGAVPPELARAMGLNDVAGPAAPERVMGLNDAAGGLVGWDVFDAVLTPGDVILLTSWRDEAAAAAFASGARVPEGARLRRVRVVRDYGMFDRREAPQYYPDAVRRG